MLWSRSSWQLSITPHAMFLTDCNDLLHILCMLILHTSTRQPSVASLLVTHLSTFSLLTKRGRDSGFWKHHKQMTPRCRCRCQQYFSRHEIEFGTRSDAADLRLRAFRTCSKLSCPAFNFRPCHTFGELAFLLLADWLDFCSFCPQMTEKNAERIDETETEL